MISSVFVDRPRLAIVIAIVITHRRRAGAAAHSGGAISRHRAAAGHGHRRPIPAPRRRWWRASVAQPLEAQVVGVDKMLYMKSTSGNDGSYTLTVSFALGTNPDIDTVNVNNRVQTALSQLPTEVQPQGLTVQKKSSAILQFLVLYSDERRAGSAVHHQLRDHQRARRDFAHAGRRPGQPVRQAELFDADLVRYAAAGQPQPARRPTSSRRSSAQNVQAPVGRIGARPISNDQQFQFNVQTQGRLTTPAAVRQHRAARQPRRLGAADQRRRPRRDRRAEHGQRCAAQRPSRRCRSASTWRPAPTR